MDLTPLFDSLLNSEDGGRFVLEPDQPFTIARRYQGSSNVLPRRTADGCARLIESLNGGTAGRLLSAELARRMEGLRGTVRFEMMMKPGLRGNTVSSPTSRSAVVPFSTSNTCSCRPLTATCFRFAWSDEGISGEVVVAAGGRRTVAVIASRAEPVLPPSIDEIEHVVAERSRQLAECMARSGPSFSSVLRSRMMRSAERLLRPRRYHETRFIDLGCCRSRPLLGDGSWVECSCLSRMPTATSSCPPGFADLRHRCHLVENP